MSRRWSRRPQRIGHGCLLDIKIGGSNYIAVKNERCWTKQVGHVKGHYNRRGNGTEGRAR